MNHVEITTNGPVLEKLCRVTVSDLSGSDMPCLYQADVETARAEGQGALLDLILDNCGGKTFEILEAAVANSTPVSLDGEDMPHDLIRSALDPSYSPVP